MKRVIPQIYSWGRAHACAGFCFVARRIKLFHRWPPMHRFHTSWCCLNSQCTHTSELQNMFQKEDEPGPCAAPGSETAHLVMCHVPYESHKRSPSRTFDRSTRRQKRSELFACTGRTQLEVHRECSPVARRFCQTCQIIRPPRASHCRDCDNCVLRQGLAMQHQLTGYFWGSTRRSLACHVGTVDNRLLMPQVRSPLPLREQLHRSKESWDPWLCNPCVSTVRYLPGTIYSLPAFSCPPLSSAH